MAVVVGYITMMRSGRTLTTLIELKLAWMLLKLVQKESGSFKDTMQC